MIIIRSPNPSAPCACGSRRLVLDLCNQQNITRGLQGKFSVYHGAAIGLVRGKAGIREYTDEAVNDPAIKRVRESATCRGRSVAHGRSGRNRSGTDDSGEKLSRFVEKSLGNIHRPLTNQQLEEKFRDQAVLALPAERVERIIELCWRIDQLADVNELVRTGMRRLTLITCLAALLSGTASS